MLGNRWPQKPPLGSRIDREGPLSQGIAAFWALNEGAGLPFELVGQGLATSTGTSNTTWTTSPAGPALSFNGANQYLNIGTPRGLIITGPITIVFAGAPAASLGQQIVLDTRNTSQTAGFVVSLDQDGNNELSLYNPVTGTYAYSSNGAVDGNWHVFGLSMSATASNGVAFYRDGAAWGTGTLSAFAGANNTGNAWAIGSKYIGSPLHYYSGKMGWFGVWNRALSAAEHARLTTNPWQVFQPRQTYLGLMAATPVIYSLSGPSSGITGTASSAFTLTPSLTTTDTVTFSDGGHGGTFTPSSLTFTASGTPQTFTYTPATVSSLSLTLTSGHSDVIDGSPAAYTAEPVPISYTLTGPSRAVAEVASGTFTLTPASTVTDSITFSDGGHGGTFTPSSLTFTASATAQTFTYTPATVGSLSLTLTSMKGGAVTGSPASLPVTAISYTLAGPATSVAPLPSGTFTLTPASTVTDSITFSDGGHGGTFTPSSLTFTASATAQTFTYTSAVAGTRSLTLTSADGGTITGSPASLTVAAISYTLTGPSSAVAEVASGNFTLTPASAVTDMITFSDGGHGGTFTPSSLTFTASSTPQTFTYTSPVAGTRSLTLTSADGGTITGAPASLTVTAIGYTLAGPACGAYLAASSAFTLTPASAVTDTITFSDGGHGGTFTPSSLTFTASSTAQTFTYTPATVGLRYLTPMSTDGGTIIGAPARYYQTPTQGSIKFTNQCTFATASNTLLSGQTSATVAFRIQFNTPGGSGFLTAGLIDKGSAQSLATFTAGAVGTYYLAMSGNSGASIGIAPEFQVGIPNHVVISWSNGSQAIYVNGTLIAEGTAAQATVSAYTGAFTIGSQAVVPVNLQISDVAIWNGYAASQADVVNLYSGISNPLTLATPASAWYPLGGTSGSQPNVASDLGFLDWTGNGYALTKLSGSAANAVYAGALGFTPPIEVSAYVSKSGKLAVFHPVATAPAASGAYVPQAVTSVASNPTITWNGNPIQADGPTWDSMKFTLTFAAYRLQCGSIESVGIASGGSGYDGSTRVTAVGGGATVQATFGTPVLGTGVTEYTVGGVGSYGQYTNAPAVATSGGTYTTAPSARGVYSGNTFTIVPSVGGILGCGSGVTVAPTMTLSGGVGGGATATATLSGSGIGGITITAAGSGYSATTTTAHVIDTQGGTGSGAVLAVNVSGGTVASITVSSAGSGYTNPVVVIQPGTGSGATATAALASTNNGGSGAAATATISGGSVSSLTITAGGSGYTSAPTVTIYGGGGSGAAAAAVVSGGAVTGLTLIRGGTGFTATPTVAIGGGIASPLTVHSAGSGYGLGTSAYIVDPTGTGAALTVNISAGGVASITASAGSGYTNPTVIVQDGAQAIVIPTVGPYIQSVPVTSGGSGYTSMPTLSVSDGAGSGAALVPVMSGASAGDVLSYTAAWGWLQCATGGAVVSPPPGSSTPASIANFTGTVEGQAGLLPGFPTSRTMQLGVNIGAGQTAVGATDSCFRNYMKRVDMSDSPWSVSSGSLTVLADGTPVSWTAPSATLTCQPYSIYYATNSVDGRLSPSLIGTWTLIYDDPNIGTSNAANVTLTVNVNATAGTPTVTISGTTVTKSYLVAYVANPITWNIGLEVHITQPQGLWQLENFALIPPQPAGYPVSRTPALAVDGNVVSWLTTPRSQVPACLRTMDVCSNFGISNFVDPTDLQGPNSFSWGNPRVGSAPPASTTDATGTILSGTVNFQYVRPYITDPSQGSIASGGNGTYGWEITGRLYSSQWGLTGTDSFGPYLQLPPGDNGTFAVGSSSPQYAVAIELVSSLPHNLKTGQIIYITGNDVGKLAVYGTTQVADIYDATCIAYVTGEYTIMITTGVPYGVPGSAIAMLGLSSTIPLTTQLPVGIGVPLTATLQVPYGSSTPFEFVAAMASQLGTNLWVSVPGFASPACSTAIAERVAANLTPGLKVYVEYMNEQWNSTTNNFTVIFLGSLMSYLPTGTPVGTRYTTTGVALSENQFYTVMSGVHHDIWAGVFSALGRGNDVVRVFGSQFAQPSLTQNIVSCASRYGIPMDAVAVAPYYDYSGCPAVPSILAAFTPAGYSGSPGNWPVDAMVDFAKHFFYYNTPYWALYSQIAPLLAAWGQPVNPVVLSSGGTGGSLAAGAYYAYCTYVNSSGQETTVGNSQAMGYVGTGQVLTVTLPPLPTWLTGGSMNIYLTPVNSLPGTEVLYANVPNASLSTAGTTNYTCTVANAGTVSPPASCQIPLGHSAPRPVAYECAPDVLVPGNVPFNAQLARDVFYHPAYYDLVTAFFWALQTGNPSVSGSGLSLANFYQLTDSWSQEGEIWSLAVSTAQQPGYGNSNEFATAQGGSPADNRAHDLGNQAVALQAARDWWDSFAPPSPVVTATLPASGATAVPIANSVVATFSEAIQSGSLGFTVAPTAGGSNVGGTVSLDNTETIATFVPGRPLNYATGYTASIEATGANGGTMTSAYTCSWTTQDLPPSGSWYLQPINYGFSSAIVATNLTMTATLNGVSIPGTTSYNSSTYVATFTPSSPWTASKYILTISGATAPDGTPMATESIVFTPGTATPGKGWFGGLGRPTMKV